MPQSSYSEITKKGSKTFYTASLFFPKHIREQVFILYAYVRTIDDLIDSMPPQIALYESMKKRTLKALVGTSPAGDEIIDGFVSLVKKLKIRQDWIEAFYVSQEMDLTVSRYRTFDDLVDFTYGVAEVIGLMMSKIMALAPDSFKYAQLLGRSMQLLNIIRDIKEDYQMGRIYIPQNDMERFDVSDFSLKTKKNRENIAQLVRFEIKRFRIIHAEAVKGLSYIPPRFRIPIETASRLYSGIADRIENEPLSIFFQKVRPDMLSIASSVVVSYGKVYVPGLLTRDTKL